MPQPLSSKEASLFRQVVKFYESKQNKKGLKAAEQILRKNPNHGETLAMKALIINSQGKHEEAMALCKEALRFDMKSHVCWHVYGLLWRSAKNLEEAIKAYKFALRIEPESQQIQRDLALLQVQMRDYAGYIVSRRAMLNARSHVRQNWTALAVAYHLAGNLVEAERVLSTYEDTLKSPPPKSDHEHSEAVLYKNTVIADSGDIEKALDHLNAVADNNLDKLAVLELRAKYLLKLDRKDQAETAYRALLARNPEYRAYYRGLEQSMSLEPGNVKALKAVYDEFAEKNPRGDAARWIPLGFLEGDDFREAADVYLRRMLGKGAPSTFANVKALYTDKFKQDTIQQLVLGYEKELSEEDTEDGKEAKTNGTISKFKLSTQFFLAQHFDYFRSRDLEKAQSYIDKAIELSPKSVEFYMTKARIWKHFGDLQKAAETMEHGRTVDERDRYINTKTAKYQLRHDENEKALGTMSKFTRNETVGGPLGDLYDMQCMWFLAEDGESYLRQQKLGLALKRFKSIYDIFDVWQEDQYDFHTFSFRKGQIRAYVDMIRWEDQLRDHPFYSRAAIGATKAYILLHEHPELAHGSLTNGVNGESTSPNDDAVERKKAMKKAKREQQKQEKAAAEKKAAENAKPVPEGETKKGDPDPKGTKLLETTRPLEDAIKFIVPLLEIENSAIEAQNVGFELYIRAEKYLLALKCLLSATKIDPEDAKTFEQAIRFRKTIETPSTPLDERVSKVIEATFKIIPQDADLVEQSKAFFAKHPKSIPHIISYARTMHELDPKAESPAKELLAILELPDASISIAREIQDLLASWKSAEKEAFTKKAIERWPRATVFNDQLSAGMAELAI